MAFRMFFASLLIITIPILAVASPGTNELNRQCRYEKELDANSYWFWREYNGIVETHDNDDRRYGYFIRNTELCFHTSITKLGEINQKIIGYKRAAREWLGVISHKQNNWDAPETVKARQKFKAITGLDFNNLGDLRNWWLENNDYLTWSVEDQRLMVDEAAKANKTPILSFNSVVEVPAEDYWYFEGMDLIDRKNDKGSHDDNGYRVFSVFTNHGPLNYRVALKGIGKASDKEAGYLKAVTAILERRLVGRYLEILDPKEEQHFFEQLEKLTAQKFDSRDGWLKWWKKSKGHLALSKDGKYLTLKQGRQ